MAGDVKSSPSDGIRVRRIAERGFRTQRETWLDGGTVGKTGYLKTIEDYSISGTQYTESEGHPIRSSKLDGKIDLGGDFYTQKVFPIFAGGTSLRTASAAKVTPTLGYRYYDNTNGLCLAIDPKSVLYSASDAKISEAEIDAYGATAISRIKPTNPVAGLTAALAEIRTGGLPHLVGSQTWRDRTLTAKNAGGEYLNTEFGWLPLISDIQDFGSGVARANDVITRYRNGIGKVIRRSYDFPIERTTTETILGTNKTPFCRPAGSNEWGTTGVMRGGYLLKHQEVMRKIWFRGAFSYYFPDKILGSRRLGDMAILAKQLGLVPTPDVVWQVTPWSWAVDWFSNTGDVISNWSAFHVDGLVLRYGYVMVETIITDTYSLVGARAQDGAAHPVSDVVIVNHSKQRRKANPYGFGIADGSLSAFQLSILAALGMSRT